MRYQFIKAHRQIWPIGLMCKVLEVNRSGYYSWLKNKVTKRSLKQAKLLEQINYYYEKSRCLYRSPRITRELRSRGIKVNVKTVARIMRINNLQARTVKKFKRTTKASAKGKFNSNLLNQNFKSPEPDKIWTGDITYISTRQGWLYLAVVLDLYSGKIVGYSFSKNLSAEIVVNAMDMALVQRKPAGGLIFHSDRGSQYTGREFRKLLDQHKIIQSMSSTGNCYDNAVTESFFHTPKTELTNFIYYFTRDDAKKTIFEYIEVFYNRQRLHSYLDYSTPEKFEYRYFTNFNSNVA